MNSKFGRYHLEFPTHPDHCDRLDDNLDVRVHLEHGEVYWGTLYTIRNVERLMTANGSTHFWATDMVIVPELSMEAIEAGMHDLIERGYLPFAFTKIEG